jgi:hypothetical protein
VGCDIVNDPGWRDVDASLSGDVNLRLEWLPIILTDVANMITRCRSGLPRITAEFDQFLENRACRFSGGIARVTVYPANGKDARVVDEKRASFEVGK